MPASNCQELARTRPSRVCHRTSRTGDRQLPSSGTDLDRTARFQLQESGPASARMPESRQCCDGTTTASSGWCIALGIPMRSNTIPRPARDHFGACTTASVCRNPQFSAGQSGFTGQMKTNNSVRDCLSVCITDNAQVNWQFGCCNGRLNDCIYPVQAQG